MTEYAGPERRHHDPIQEQIEQLIMAASDPKDKAFLLILNKIAGSLDVNTSLTQTLSDDLKAHTAAFAAHEQKEMALINQGRGFWRGLAIAVVAVQVLGGFILFSHLKEDEKTRSDVDALIVSMAEHKEHHKQEERFSGGPKVK